MVNQMCVTRPQPVTSINVSVWPGSMLRESPFRPLGSVLEARPAAKSFFAARSAGTWPTDTNGRSDTIAALKISAQDRVGLVIMPSTLTALEFVSRPRGRARAAIPLDWVSIPAIALSNRI